MTKEERSEYNRKYKAEHREELREYNRKYWQFYKRIRRKRYRDNPEYRAAELERKAKTRVLKPITERPRDKYGRFTKTTEGIENG